MSSSAQPPHPSLEKTAPMLPGEERTAPRGPSPEAIADGVSDLDLLREKYARKEMQCAALLQLSEELKTTLSTVQSDTSGQKAEQLAELRTLQDLLHKMNARFGSLETDLSAQQKITKQLKAQNLELQYHLQHWGIPVAAGDGNEAGDVRQLNSVGEAFFPPLLAPPGLSDPITPVLRGDLATFCFPNLLQFLAASSLHGVLTVLTQGIVTKLYLENAVLLCAGWNNRDPELGLAALLEESGLATKEILDSVRSDSLHDMELASLLVEQEQVSLSAIQAGLREHARVILVFLFHLRRGAFLFQPGQIQKKRDLFFRLSVTDLLLKAAARVDERLRGGIANV